jgi:hypothetical protein
MLYRSSMYTRITESGGRRYLQLVEGHRDEIGKVRIKVVASLGRLDKLGPAKLDPLINGLNRAVGRLECVFHVMVGTVSSGGWAVIPRDRGQPLQGMVGAHST